MPKAAKVLYKIDGEVDEAKKSSIESWERIASIAKKEIEGGFPFLYTNSAIMLYSYSEGAIKRLITTYFENSDIQSIKELANIKIILAEYIKLDRSDRFDYLFAQYEKTLTAGIQYGVKRFETLLGPIGLNGPVKPQLSKSLLELSQIRNVILHRGGIADKHFVQSCPWLNYNTGDTVIIGGGKYNEYFTTICEYIVLIGIRLGEQNGKDMSEYKVDDDDDCA